MRFRALSGWRWLGENGFTLFFMAPLILGGAALIFQPYVEAAGRVLREGADEWITGHAAAAVAALAAGLLVARFSGTVRDVYALNPADHYLDALPVSVWARLHVVLATRVLKAIPIAAALLFALYLAGPPEARLAEVARSWGPALAVGAVAFGLVETTLALVLVRIGMVGAVRLALAGAIAIATAAFLVDALGRAAAGLAVVAYPIAAFGFARWRIEDRERAREALARARRTGPRFERLADRLFGPQTGAQIMRDLRLVRRGFSTIVYLAVGAALLFPGLAAWAAGRYALEPAERSLAIESATVLSAFALASVTHALVSYERPRLWIDLTSGVEPSQFPRAKRWVGRLLGTPAMVLGCVAALAAGVPIGPLEVGKLAWLAWATSTLTAVLCYEVAERPAAGVVFAFIAAAGIALLFVFFAPFWPLWFVGYYYLSTNLFERAGEKAASRNFAAGT
jgi:hypothetical protein